MHSLIEEPTGREQKPGFHEVPSEIVLKLQEVCNGRIVYAETAFGGFSASAGFIITFSDGRRVFVKGTHPLDTSHGAANLRQEIMAYETVSMLEDVSPGYIGVVSDGGGDDGWMLGVWEHAEHDAASASLEAVVSLLKNWPDVDAVKASLTPASSHVFVGKFFDNSKKWERIRVNEGTRQRFLSLFSDPKAGGWLEKNISALCNLQSKGALLGKPEGVVHGDLRLDNILFTPRGSLAIDWPNICFGPRVFDVAFLFSSLEAFGLCSFDEALRAYDGGIAGEDYQVMLGCLSGYFAEQAYRDVPVMMPRLRWMQRSMLLAQLNQLAKFGVIESPPRMHGETQA